MTSQTTDPMAALQWTFGDRLRKVRRVFNLSQQDLADTLHVSAASVAAWEVGLNTPRGVVDVAKRIEASFGVPASWLLGLNVTTPGPDGPGGGDGASLPRLDSNQQPFGYLPWQVTEAA